MLTPRQRELARHALGLPNDRKTSYRNRFCAGNHHAGTPDWCDMVAAGHATASTPQSMLGGDRMFYLTPDGATAALEPGERLDPEDFPASNRKGG